MNLTNTSTHTQQGLMFAHTNWESGGSRDRTWQFWTCTEPTCIIHIEKLLWLFQTVEIKGTCYCLTRLGFSLNVAPSIMTAIMCAIRQHCPTSTTSLWMRTSCLPRQSKNTSISSGWRARNRSVDGMEQKCLACAWAVVRKESTGGVVVTSRGFRLTSCVGAFFSVCGKLVGHFPVCGWLRVAGAAIKRRATSVLSRWDDGVRDATLRSMLMETVARVTHDNPVWGNWYVDENKFTVWVDPSSLALGIALVVDEFIVEDACWFCLENDSRHINLAELDATLKGVNLAFQWQARVLHIVTDSACVQ